MRSSTGAERDKCYMRPASHEHKEPADSHRQPSHIRESTGGQHLTEALAVADD